jgi:spore maturation protein CgeB
LPLTFKAKTRILLVGPHWFGGLTESVAHALRQLNCELEIFYFNKVVADDVSKSIEIDTRENLRNIASRFGITPTLFLRQLFWYMVMSREIDRRLVQLANDFMPDLVLVLKGEMLLPKTLKKLKTISSKPVLANWWVDNPILQDDKNKWLIYPHCVPHYDSIFIFDRAYFAPLKELGAKKIFFLPCAADPAKYHHENLSSDQRSQLSCNVCFIASYYSNRGELISPFLSVPGLAIWGGGWSEFLKRKGINNANDIVRGDYLPVEDVNRAYQAAQFVLNSHHSQTKRGGLNSRAFEIPASGGAQLMDYVPEMEDLLKPGEEVIVYRSPKEGATLAKELINDPGARDKIARAGYERVMAEHTYTHRMKTILDSI